jgi:hypothetical protein
MADVKTGFQLVFPENLKKDSNLSTTPQLSFDDLEDFIEERERIRRACEANGETQLKIDYSTFSNHVFFDSAISKFNIAKSKILTQYPYNGTSEEIDAFFLTSSDYENYVCEQWPRGIGYAQFKGADSQYISASDIDNDLYIGTSSLYISAWINPVVDHQNIILQYASASFAPGLMKSGYDLYLSGATDVHLKFSLYSGSQKFSVSSSYSQFTGSWNNVAVLYDTNADLVSLYVNDNRVSSGTLIWSSINFNGANFLIGSGSQYTAGSSSFAFYSGSVDEVRVLVSASEIFHQKNYNRPIYSEDYVKLYYKFNEGIIGDTSIDPVIVDYSKSGLHGNFTNYTTECRVSGAVMSQDIGDPILYNFHPSVIAFTSSIETSASLYDKFNNNSIFNLISPGIIDEDNRAQGLLTAFSLAMARFFDELKSYIDQFGNLRITNYDDANETPDILLPYLQRYFGWKVTEHFGNSMPSAFLFGDKVMSTGSLDVSLLDIRNQFWRRILNNLLYLLKTKGKRNNLDAFFNVLGVNKENINIKEYGYLPGGSLADTRIHKEKVMSMLGVGTGSVGTTSSSFVQVVGPFGTPQYTVETLVQLPFASASYTNTQTQGGIWQFVNTAQTKSYTLLWSLPGLNSTTGRFILTGSDGQSFTSSLVSVFDGDMVHVAAGIGSGSLPFISLRTIDNDTLDFSASFVGTTVLSGAFTGSDYNFIIGANSGTLFSNPTQGFFAQAKIWSRQLSSSEIDSHALHFQNVGTNNPLEFLSPLVGHWALDEQKTAGADGLITDIVDLSRNGKDGVGNLFPVSENPYQKFLYEYNYLSPAVDLKWTENKIRIRNKTELKMEDVAHDTNEVSLEFNLVDALNEDITKIFTTLDTFNNLIGEPINKYRDEYSDLESVRRKYFERLGDSLNFTKFFRLFTWFDKKLSDSIKQLLPARVRFIGGEQVVESHMLERPKYTYRYSVFRTPQEPGEANISGVFGFTGQKQVSLEANISCSRVDSCMSPRFVSAYRDGDEKVDRSQDNFYAKKLSGDTSEDINNPNTAINYKNQWARRSDTYNLQHNLDGQKSGSFVSPDLGNGYEASALVTSKDDEHYFGAHKKYIKLIWYWTSGSATENSCSADWTFRISGSAGPVAEGLWFSRSLYDSTNNLMMQGVGPAGSAWYNNNNSTLLAVFGQIGAGTPANYTENSVFSCEISCSTGIFDSNNVYIYDFPVVSDTVKILMNDYGSFSGPDERGYYKFSVNKDDPRVFQKFNAIASNRPRLVLSSAIGTIHYFRNVKQEFYMPLSDFGVKYYKQLDNQNYEFVYLNNSVMKGIV